MLREIEGERLREREREIERERWTDELRDHQACTIKLFTDVIYIFS